MPTKSYATNSGISQFSPINATYVTLSGNSALTNERILTGTSNQVILTDNGAGSTIVLSLPQNINTTADVTFDTVVAGTQMGIGGVLSANTILYVDTSITGSSTATGMGLFATLTPATGNKVYIQDLGGIAGSASVTVAEASGIRVRGITKGTAGTFTALYGIQVLAQTAATSNYGVAIEAAGTQTLWVSSLADSTNAAGGIAFGSSRDTNLYRSAANTLKTDDSFTIAVNGQIDGTLGVTGLSTLGSLTVTGATLLNGTVSLGDASGDVITINGNTINLANDTDFVTTGGVNGMSIDGTTFSVDGTNNRIGIGTAAPATSLHVANAPARLDGIESLYSYYAGQFFAGWITFRSRGSITTPSKTLTGDQMMVISARGYQDTSSAYSAASRADWQIVAAEDFTSTAQGMYQVWDVTAIGGTTVVEGMRLTDVGNLKIGGSAARGTTEGTRQLVLFNGTAPVGTLTNGVSFYSASGEARVMDSAGNSTLLSPHDQETHEWIYDSIDTTTGKHLRVKMEQLIKAVNEKLGLDFIEEFIEEKYTQ